MVVQMKGIIVLNKNECNEVVCMINSCKSSNNPIVVMFYGTNGNRVCQHRIGIKLEHALQENNIDMIRFDYSNTGTSIGEFENSTLQQRYENVECVLDYISGKYNREIYLLGFSDGARCALKGMLYMPSIKGVILWNPIINVLREQKTSYKQKTYSKMMMHPIYKIPVIELLGVGLNTTFLKQMKEEQFSKIIDFRKDNIYILFGTGDALTESIRTYMETIHANIRYVEQADHLFNRFEWEQTVIYETINWIKISEEKRK